MEKFAVKKKSEFESAPGKKRSPEPEKRKVGRPKRMLLEPPAEAPQPPAQLHTHMHEFRLNIDTVHGLAAVRHANTRERVGDRGQHYRHKLIYMYMRALEA